MAAFCIVVVPDLPVDYIFVNGIMLVNPGYADDKSV